VRRTPSFQHCTDGLAFFHAGHGASDKKGSLPI
jgi:hypothetical protein